MLFLAFTRLFETIGRLKASLKIYVEIRNWSNFAIFKLWTFAGANEILAGY